MSYGSTSGQRLDFVSMRHLYSTLLIQSGSECRVYPKRSRDRRGWDKGPLHGTDTINHMVRENTTVHLSACCWTAGGNTHGLQDSVDFGGVSKGATLRATVVTKLNQQRQ